MNWNIQEVVALIVAITALLPAVAAFLIKIHKIAKEQIRLKIENAKLKDDYQRVWLGFVARGFLEAQKAGYLVYEHDEWNTTAAVREVYAEVHDQLRRIYLVLRRKFERDPTDAEISFNIEMDDELQNWMIDHACPTLGINQHGCLALATIVARSRNMDTPVPKQGA